MRDVQPACRAALRTTGDPVREDYVGGACHHCKRVFVDVVRCLSYSQLLLSADLEEKHHRNPRHTFRVQEKMYVLLTISDPQTCSYVTYS